MKKLATLRSRLRALGRRRRIARWWRGFSALALVMLWALVGVFLLDWTFDLEPPQRIVALAAWAGVTLWAFRWLTWPWLGQRETELDMALLVEQQQRIDSDLVAALQFESPEATRWGSPQLETAVVDYVAEFGSHVDLRPDSSRGPLVRRGVALLATCLALGVAALIYPAHFRAFCNRLLLGAMHYPMNTSIDRVVINDQEIDLGSLGGRPARSPYGQPLLFEIHWSGTPPLAGRAELATIADGTRTHVDLSPDERRPGVFTGVLSRLVDSVKYQLYLGDAWTDPRDLLAIPLPVVTVALEPTPPKYAASAEAALDNQAGARQISIIEGTRVAVRLECANKPLKAATLTVGEGQYPLVAQDTNRKLWLLDSPDTPLARITEPVRYEIQVTDDDDLHLSEAIQGFIRIKTDRPPRVTAALVTQHVLPTGKPKITYGAADDYGVARLRVNRQILREDGTMEDDIVEIPLGGEPQKLVQGKFPVDLSPLKLAKGDQVKITLEAYDYRGEAPGKSAISEPLVLHVTDERGVLAAMTETDQRSARQMDAIIQRQLGIGE